MMSSIKTLSRMTFIMITLSVATLGITALSNVTHSITNQHKTFGRMIPNITLS